jgi:hypothetical protein
MNTSTDVPHHKGPRKYFKHYRHDPVATAAYKMALSFIQHPHKDGSLDEAFDSIIFFYLSQNFQVQGDQDDQEYSAYEYKGNVYRHYRKADHNWQPGPKGGRTLCFLMDEDGNLASVGIARCSHKDGFCYRLGREISEGKARLALNGRS